MISSVSAAKPVCDFSGLKRAKLVHIFEKQLLERKGGEFSASHRLHDWIIYACPLFTGALVAGVLFFPISVFSITIALIAAVAYGVNVAIISLSRAKQTSALRLCISELKNKYVDIGVIEERDIRELIRFSDSKSLMQMIDSMNSHQRLAAFAENPARLKPMLNANDDWKKALNPSDDKKKSPLKSRVEEIEGEMEFKLPGFDEEWDDLMTERMDEYLTSHMDLYSLNALVEGLNKHPDCEKLRAKLAQNLLSIRFDSPFYEWKKLFEMARIINVKEVDEKFDQFLLKRFTSELDSPSGDFKALYMALKEKDKLPLIPFHLNNIRALYELEIEGVKQAVLHFVKNNVESIRNSNVWKINEMPQAIRNLIYPDVSRRYF
ncbi:MAG: hypothetical protein ACK4HV_00025 [Parachlamydiaceae bacterium]